MCIYVYVSMYVYSMYLYQCTVCMYVCMYVSLYVAICICVCGTYNIENFARKWCVSYLKTSGNTFLSFDFIMVGSSNSLHGTVSSYNTLTATMAHSQVYGPTAAISTTYPTAAISTTYPTATIPTTADPQIIAPVAVTQGKL